MLRAETGCFLAGRKFPEYAGLPEEVPDDLLDGFSGIVTGIPCKPFLSFCAELFDQYAPDVAANRLSNLLMLIPSPSLASEYSGIPEGPQMRAASVALTVSLIEPIQYCMGNLMNRRWVDRSGCVGWARAVVRLAHSIPHLWHCADHTQQVRIMMFLAARYGRTADLIDFCRERNSLDSDMVESFLKNETLPLAEGVL